MSEAARRRDPAAGTPAPAGGTLGPPSGLQRLDAAAVRFRRGLRGELQMEQDGLCHLRVSLRLPFPLTRRDGWVSVVGADGREIGLLPSLQRLDRESRALAEEELRLRYFMPLVTAVLDLRDELHGGRSGGVVWELMTDRGPATLHMPNTNEHIQPLGGGRLLLTDSAGNRYEIPDVRMLDGASRARLTRYIWL